MPSEKPGGSDDPTRLTVVMCPDPTADHAMELVVTGKKKKPAGCSKLSITCKPTLYSCTPVGACLSYSIAAPGCSPLVCSPVKTP